MILNALLNAVGDIVAPPICPICQEELTMGKDKLCRSCMEALPHLPERRCRGCGGPNDSATELCSKCLQLNAPRPWSLAVSAYPFAGNVRLAIHCYKYRKHLCLAPFFGTSLYEAWLEQGNGMQADAVTYIPLHYLRYIRRGYNQSELLAQILGSKLGCPCLRLLKRCRSTAQQAKLGMAQRMKNMRRAFVALNAKYLAGKSILLVDDVFTTGATLSAATKTLLAAGVKQVAVITIACA